MFGLFKKKHFDMIFTPSINNKVIMRTSDQENKYQRAQARVAELKEFYNHLAIYLIFVVFFLALNYFTSGFFWAIFPILGWGLGILGHAANTFRWNPFFSKDWEQRKIDEYLRNDDLK